MDLQGKRVLVTGVGIKPVKHIFKDIKTGLPSHTPVIVNGEEFKANVGTAAAMECARAGAIIHLVSDTETKLQIIKKWIEQVVPQAKVEYTVVDLTSSIALHNLVDSLPNDLPLYWIQSLGLGAGTVKLKDDNPYLRIEDITPELIQAEHFILTSTITLLQLLLPRFRQQDETRICIVSSMSAIRGYPYAGAHTAAKGALSRFINSARMELDKDHIYITDIRPGMVDTGANDSEGVRQAEVEIGKVFGYDFSGDKFTAMSPQSVGKAIVMSFTTDANILSVNMVARGQEVVEAS